MKVPLYVTGVLSVPPKGSPMIAKYALYTWPEHGLHWSSLLSPNEGLGFRGLGFNTSSAKLCG